MLNFGIGKVAHHIDIVRRKIKRHANIRNARREWAQPPRMQVKNFAEFTRDQAPLQHVGGNLIMNAGWDNDRYQVRESDIEHVPVIAKARHVKAAHGPFQCGFVRFRHAYQLRLLLRQFSQYAQVVHAHRTRANDSNPYRHRASTSSTIVSRSSRLKAGWTGSDSTWHAAFSASGR